MAPLPPAVLAARARPPRRPDRHGGAGHLQRSHVPHVRPRRQPHLPVRQGQSTVTKVRNSNLGLCFFPFKCCVFLSSLRTDLAKMLREL